MCLCEPLSLDCKCKYCGKYFIQVILHTCMSCKQFVAFYNDVCKKCEEKIKKNGGVP